MSSKGHQKTFQIRKTTENDRNDVLKFIRKYYLLQIPSAFYFNVVSEDNPVCEEMENVFMKNMDKPSWNFVAVDDGKIVGACLNKEVTKSNYLKQSDAADEKFAKYAKFWLDIKREGDLFGKYPGIDKALVVDNLAVDDEYRGLGIGGQLITKTRELAKELGYELLTANCSSFYSAEIFKKLGYEIVVKRRYDTYKINENETIKPIPPHEHVEILALRI